MLDLNHSLRSLLVLVSNNDKEKEVVLSFNSRCNFVASLLRFSYKYLVIFMYFECHFILGIEFLMLTC